MVCVVSENFPAIFTCIVMFSAGNPELKVVYTVQVLRNAYRLRAFRPLGNGALYVHGRASISSSEHML